MVGLSWDYLNDSHSKLPKSAEFVDTALAVCPLSDRARTDAHANACVQSERCAGRGDNCPDFRDAKAGAHVHARYSGATRTDHRPQRGADGAKPAQLQSGHNFPNAAELFRRASAQLYEGKNRGGWEVNRTDVPDFGSGDPSSLPQPGHHAV